MQPFVQITINEFNYIISPRNEDEKQRLADALRRRRAICVLDRDNDDVFAVLDVSKLPIRGDLQEYELGY